MKSLNQHNCIKKSPYGLFLVNIFLNKTIKVIYLVFLLLSLQETLHNL